MKTINKRTRILLALLLALSVLGSYHVLDVRALDREAQVVAHGKASEVLGKQAHKGVNTVSSEAMVWRTIPVVGQASAMITVHLRHRTASGSELSQTFDYVYRRDHSGWVEMEHRHEHGSTQHSGHVH